MNQCKHERLRKDVHYVTFEAPDLTGEPRLRFDMSGMSEGVADAIVHAHRLASALVGSETVWSFYSIEKQCLDCGGLIAFHQLKGDMPE